ncbi:MAG: LysM peptidoglycan-binding domain-containing protein [Chloroflexi bacterium]|nr:LysM peptidoglycan-binding domain-containing protein [Chloroflexota bacterium]
MSRLGRMIGMGGIAAALWLTLISFSAMPVAATNGANLMMGQVEATATPAPSFTPTFLPPTPTPNAEGLILITVQANDTLWSIAARAGLTLEQLLEYNDLTRDTFIQPGQQLIIGFAETGATPTLTATMTVTVVSTLTVTLTGSLTPEPTATSVPTPTVTPTPETENQGGSLCLTAFDDANQNGLYDAGEALRAAVAFTVTHADNQTVTSNYVTDGVTETYCLEGLEPGNYLVTRSKVTNEQVTTPDNWAVAMVNGAVTNLVFGSYIEDVSVVVAEGETDANTEGNETAATGTGSLNEAETTVTPEEDGGGRVVTGIVIVVVVLAVLLLVGVLAVILSARRNTV